MNALLARPPSIPKEAKEGKEAFQLRFYSGNLRSRILRQKNYCSNAALWLQTSSNVALSRGLGTEEARSSSKPAETGFSLNVCLRQYYVVLLRFCFLLFGSRLLTVPYLGKIKLISHGRAQPSLGSDLK
jgi:hypothetical protein